MRRILFICIACGMLVSLSACGKTDRIENNADTVTGTNGTSDENQDNKNPDNSKDETENDFVQPDKNAPESAGDPEATSDPYVGEYNDYDVDEPMLEIQKNNDGTYKIQIGVFRLTQLYDCAGSLTENGIEFFTTEQGDDQKISGTITLKEDIATVTITEGWYSDETSEYKYHKTSDIPNIYVPDDQ